MPAEIDEQVRDGEPPVDYVCRLARQKAQAVAANAPPEAIILAADTTVMDVGLQGEQILGKPANADEAAGMLRRLRGRTHRVFTALAALRKRDGKLLQEVSRSAVTMRSYSEDEMLAYIASGDPLDKAGAYAIQHKGFHPVARLDGCYTNVVGLPLCRVTQMLAQLGCVSPQPAPYACLYMPDLPCRVPPEVTGDAEVPVSTT